MAFYDDNGRLQVDNPSGSKVQFPRLCPICGSTESNKKMSVQSSYWPKSLIPLAFLGVAPFLLAVILTEKKCPVVLYPCKMHYYQLNKKLFIWVGSVLTALLLVGGAWMFSSIALGVIGGIIFAAALPFYWIVQPITFSRFDDGLFTVNELPSKHLAGRLDS